MSASLCTSSWMSTCENLNKKHVTSKIRKNLFLLISDCQGNQWLKKRKTNPRRRVNSGCLDTFNIFNKIEAEDWCLSQTVPAGSGCQHLMCSIQRRLQFFYIQHNWAVVVTKPNQRLHLNKFKHLLLLEFASTIKAVTQKHPQPLGDRI